MTIDQFGQKIKEKYPQYANYSDSEIGQKMIEKYPEYKGVISSSPEKVDAFLIGHPVLKGISDFIGTTGLGKGIAQGIFLKFTQEGRGLLKMVADGKMTADELEQVTGKAATTKEILGSAAQTALTIGLAGLKPTPVAGFQEGTKQFLKTAGVRAAETGGIFAGFTAAKELQNDKELDEIAKSSAIAFGLGAIGSGLFSTFITGPVKAATAKGFTSRLFRSGLGFGKTAQVAEERSNKLASDILIQHGAGTAEQLKTTYQGLAKTAESEIQELLKTDTTKHATNTIWNKIITAYKEQFPTSLTRNEIEESIKDLPLAILKHRDFITTAELNQLRREITNKMLSPATFTKAATKEGLTRELLTVGNVLSETVKDTIPKSRPIFERYSAYIKGFDALLNKLGATSGPVSTGARVAGAVGGAAVGAGVGAMTGGPVGAAVGAGIGTVLEELGRSTIGKTGLAITLKNAGLAVDKLSQSEIGNLGNLMAKIGLIQTFTPEE